MTNLTPLEFCEKVFNYHSLGQLSYLGLVPAMLTFHIPGAYTKDMVSYMDELDQVYASRIHFYGVDVNTYPEIAIEFQIRTIPTTLFIPVGAAPTVVAGIIPSKAEMEKLILRFIPLPVVEGINDHGILPGQKLILPVH
jgi:thiol-disulfide isomerase/thioredoxin